MTEHTLKEIFERRLAEVELNFERRLRRLQDIYEIRLVALKAEVNSTHASVAHLRDDVTSSIIETYEALSNADQEQREMIGAISFNMEEMEDRLGPTFDKVFPNHGRYCAAMLSIIEKKQGGGA